MSEKRIVEIGGIKMEVDLRDCKIVENYKIGDQIKVLKKEYSDYKSYPGVIIGFDQFEQLPTVNIAYLKTDYGEAGVNFIAFNARSKDVEICPCGELDKYFSKTDAIEKLDSEILKKQDELKELEQKKKFFESNFSKYFEVPSHI